MSRGKFVGAFLCLVAMGLTGLFLWGLAAKAYWALAIPVGAGVVFAMSMLFWVGWTFMTTESATQDPALRERPEGSR